MSKQIKIGERMIGAGAPLYFIADVAANHDGDLQRAFKLIELAKEAGADAAKFQNFKAKKIVSRRGFESLGGQLSHQKNWKKSVYEVYEDASVSYDWTAQLKEKCDEVGIAYFTSPYDFESVDHVDPYVRVYKIGSGDITWMELIDYIAEKKKPVIISTGASTMEDVERAMKHLQRFTSDIVLMQCNTNYAASTDNFNYINLNVLKTYQERYPDVILGLSDHTPGHSTVLGAIALGARVFEKHFTDDNNREGPDHIFAMNPTTWSEMVESSNELYRSMGDGIKRIEDNEKDTASLQRRGLRYTKDLPAGHVLQQCDVFPLRPFHVDGISPFDVDEVIGKILLQSKQNDEYLKREDFKL
jgi:sialic acid synthase SpsE